MNVVTACGLITLVVFLIMPAFAHDIATRQTLVRIALFTHGTQLLLNLMGSVLYSHRSIALLSADLPSLPPSVAASRLPIIRRLHRSMWLLSISAIAQAAVLYVMALWPLVFHIIIYPMLISLINGTYAHHAMRCDVLTGLTCVCFMHMTDMAHAYLPSCGSLRWFCDRLVC